MTNTTSMCIFKSQFFDKGTNKVTKENVVFDTTSSRYDLAIKEVEERVKLGWSVKASFMLGGGYLRVDYVRADPNRYKDVGKTNDSKVDAEPSLSSVGSTEVVTDEVTVATEEVVEASVAQVKEADVKEVAKPKSTHKTTATKKIEDKPNE